VTKVATLLFPPIILYFMMNNFRHFVNMTTEAAMEDGDTNAVEFCQYFALVLAYHPVNQW